jgi:hypothetical protein
MGRAGKARPKFYKGGNAQKGRRHRRKAAPQSNREEIHIAMQYMTSLMLHRKTKNNDFISMLSMAALHHTHGLLCNAKLFEGSQILAILCR